mmetsp:Transcript_46441/g.104368  ORF Transcript_46441/g.104368 Transcript_46441/m.104368 type:complete len:364 (-) Transcript_46441:23-1114(-)|eukprot:CAMPEP_0197941224 /NCGR_PEP_ID=MMETSP1439-20131203/122453_1 /TAXON_ID=66791 /ORGANISM="Gonyaulax spinifera, Strain CCMP409" /LENGTH=363 /DNA_ID=CAMNT_0043564415 /DNA_START=39 /DNA_END=1130 /DNA_ORIENTATION=+
MTIAHIASVSTARGELADTEDLLDALQKELVRAQKEVNEARRAGTAVLGAVEAAMAPLMAELAVARRNCSTDEPLPALDSVPNPDQQDSQQVTLSPCALLEAEIQHLQLDIGHYQTQVEEYQAEERHRSNEIARLRHAIHEAADNMSYEQHRSKHYEACKQLSLENSSWGGLGPDGLGKRTMEVRAEQKMRELAEQRTGKISSQLTRLADDSSAHHVTIEQLSKRLTKVRASHKTKDKQLTNAIKATSTFEARLRLKEQPLDDEDEDSDAGQEDGGLDADAEDPVTGSKAASEVRGTPIGSKAASEARGTPTGSKAASEAKSTPTRGSSVASLSGRNKSKHSEAGKKGKKGTSSTGKLPQLSF